MSAQTRSSKLRTCRMSVRREGRGRSRSGWEPLEELERFAPARSTVDVPLGPQLLLVFVEIRSATNLTQLGAAKREAAIRMDELLGEAAGD